jgi:hypothetical protein
LPQVLAGLGLFSLASAGCLFWLQQLQPVFFTAAVGSLAYEAWLVQRQPVPLRTTAVKTIFSVSMVVNMLVMGSWLVLWFRYR